MVTESLAI